MYCVVIQLGAVLAVAILFFKKIFPFEIKETRLALKRNTVSLWGKIVVGCIPAGVIGVLFDDIIDFYFYTYKIVAFTLILYGILFIIIECKKKNVPARFESVDDIDGKTAILIGLFQILSLIPGTSRSGATILGAMLLGTSRFAASEFTFFMAIPIMLGASAVKLLGFGFDMTKNELIILAIGFAVSFVTSLFVVKALMRFVKTHSFKGFGVYRIILGLAVLLTSYS